MHVTSLCEYNCLCVNETICICNNIQAIILANVESSVQTDKPIQVVNWQMLSFRNLSIYNKAAIWELIELVDFYFSWWYENTQ